jgi:chromosomal replication initiator protein
MIVRDWLWGDPGPQICRIAHQVAAEAGITVDDLKSKKMARQYSIPRQKAMYLSYVHLGKSTTQIGRYFNRDHTTVIYAIRQVKKNRIRFLGDADV